MATEEFEHDHAELTKRVLEVQSELTRRRKTASDLTPSELEILAARIDALTDELLTHFTREEEGLFPFIMAKFPDLGETVENTRVAHDTICGALHRLATGVRGRPALARLDSLFDRFESAYRAHSQAERDLLAAIGPRLGEEDRRALRAHLEGL